MPSHLKKDITPPASDEALVHVATAPNEPIAGMWAGILGDNGIPSVLKSCDFRSAQYSLLTNQHLTIHVLESKALQAEEILSPLENELKNYTISRDNRLSLPSRVLVVVAFLLALVGGRA